MFLVERQRVGGKTLYRDHCMVIFLLEIQLTLSISNTVYRGGQVLGPMISDVRDYYIVNFRFPTL